MTRRRYAGSAFDGEGARRYGGRFNHRGTSLVYTSWSLSLAVLEVLAQLVGYEDLEDYVTVPAAFDERYVQVLEAADLPPDWRSLPIPASTRNLGRRWIESRASLVLRVPSVVLPAEHNYLLNPAHPDFGRLECGEARELEIDPRLLKG